MKIKYTHTNIIAKDWESLADFYVKTFECVPLLPKRNLTGQWVDDFSGTKNCTIKGIHLALPGYEKGGPTLEIFSYDPENSNDFPKEINGYGYSHLAFEVDDVQAVLDKLLKNGGTQHGKLVNKTYEELGILTAVYACDPEGNF